MGQIISDLFGTGGGGGGGDHYVPNSYGYQHVPKAADYIFSNIVNRFPPPPSPPPSTTATTKTVKSRSSGDYNRYGAGDHYIPNNYGYQDIPKAADYNFNNIVNGFPPPPSPTPSKTATTTVRSRSSGDYNRYQRILVVGDGDFSFSASLALAFGSASNMVSTSLDSYEFLANNYKRSMNNIAELKARGCKVLHGVDVTEMANHPQLGQIKYDRIIFNFPLAGFFPRDVPRQLQIQINQALVAGFMANAKRMIEANGEIHIRHKAYGFYKQWNLEQLGRSKGLWLREEVNFQLSEYPGYHTKYGFGGDNDFDCCNSKTYKFSLHPFDLRKGIPMQSSLWD